MARAYNKTYLKGAMHNLAVMLDCGVRKYGYTINDFYNKFLESNVSKQISRGNPRYLAGLSGVELADIVAQYSGKEISPRNDGSYTVGPEYWTGWVLAYYQWRSKRSFAFMQRKGLGANEVIKMYHPLHEADLMKFVDVADHLIYAHRSESRGRLSEKTAELR